MSLTKTIFYEALKKVAIVKRVVLQRNGLKAMSHDEMFEFPILNCNQTSGNRKQTTDKQTTLINYNFKCSDIVQ